MTLISKPIVFFGTEDFSLIALQALLDANAPVALVVTKPDMQKGRGHHVVEPPVKKLAKLHNIPVLQPYRIIDCMSEVNTLDQPVGVLVSYGKIIPQTVIDLFSPGIINIHPSLLPRYRGPSPIESAILNGDTETGVSIMRLDARMDAGPVYAQTRMRTTGRETAETLYMQLGELGAHMLIENLPAIIDGSLSAKAQDEVDATYCNLLTKEAGIIDWNKSAIEIERDIRAYHAWPKSRTSLAGIECIITEADIRVMSKAAPGTLLPEKNKLFVATGADWLEIKSIKPIGKKEMPIQAFLQGYRGQLD